MKLFYPCDVQEKIGEVPSWILPQKNVGVKQRLEKIGHFEPFCLMLKNRPQARRGLQRLQDPRTLDKTNGHFKNSRPSPCYGKSCLCDIRLCRKFKLKNRVVDNLGCGVMSVKSNG
jgi:hypothetical protein